MGLLKVNINKKGDFNRTIKFLSKFDSNRIESILNRYGQMGVDALSEATPVDTGLTASSWGYKIKINKGRYEIIWTNSNLGEGWANVALLLQYGHGTRNGGYVTGVDYINPALAPIFESFAEKAWKEVKSDV